MTSCMNLYSSHSIFCSIINIWLAFFFLLCNSSHILTRHRAHHINSFKCLHTTSCISLDSYTKYSFLVHHSLGGIHGWLINQQLTDTFTSIWRNLLSDKPLENHRSRYFGWRWVIVNTAQRSVHDLWKLFEQAAKAIEAGYWPDLIFDAQLISIIRVSKEAMRHQLWWRLPWLIYELSNHRVKMYWRNDQHSVGSQLPLAHQGTHWITDWAVPYNIIHEIPFMDIIAVASLMRGTANIRVNMQISCAGY